MDRNVNALTRRDMLTAAAGMAAATSVASLTVHGAARVPFGAAVNHYILPHDAVYRSAVARHCDVVVGEGAMKWAAIRPQPDVTDYTAGDELVAFAKSNGLTTRGHTLVWNAANPPWVDKLATRAAADIALRNHIAQTVARYRGTIRDWDVVNEPIAEKPTSDRDLRPGVWLSQLGAGYVDQSFRLAAEADPSGRRVINEYGIESARDQDRIKRAGFRRLILDLKSRGVPVTGVGLQAHIRGDLAIDKAGVSAFCAEMARAGLDVLVTELDVIDHTLPADPAARDTAVAKLADDFLGAVFAACRPVLVCTWGLTDKHTWVPTWFKRADGLPNRPLPFDAEWQPKPLWKVIQRYCQPT
jgi:endo-1,4-beta-xylanase